MHEAVVAGAQCGFAFEGGQHGAVGFVAVGAVVEAAVGGVGGDVGVAGEDLAAVEVGEGEAAYAGGVDEGGAAVDGVAAQVAGGVAAKAGGLRDALYSDVGVGDEAFDEAGFADAGLAAQDGLFAFEPGGKAVQAVVVFYGGSVDGVAEVLVGQ